MNNKILLPLFCLSLSFGYAQTPVERNIHRFLDAWHHAAAVADEKVFFGSMDPGSIYIGTDASERWTKEQLQKWSKFAFDRKSAWSFKAIERKVYISTEGDYAWFNETLDTWMGVCRGSGVVKRYRDKWRIKHYHLSVTVPNELIKDFISLVNRNKQPTYQPVTKFDPKRNAAQDIKDAIHEAKRTNKRILLDVGGNWCIWCRRMDAFIKSHEQLKTYLHKHFIMVKINYSRANRNKTVLSKYPKIKGYPHIFILEKDGTLVCSKNTGELEEKASYSEIKFMVFLETWAYDSSDK